MVRCMGTEDLPSTEKMVLAAEKEMVVAAKEEVIEVRGRGGKNGSGSGYGYGSGYEPKANILRNE